MGGREGKKKRGEGRRELGDGPGRDEGKRVKGIRERVRVFLQVFRSKWRIYFLMAISLAVMFLS